MGGGTPFTLNLASTLSTESARPGDHEAGGDDSEAVADTGTMESGIREPIPSSFGNNCAAKGLLGENMY